MPLAPPGAFWEQNYSLQVWCAEGRSLGLMVVQFLELSQNPSALLANKILIRRKKKNQMLWTTSEMLPTVLLSETT